MIRYNLSSKDSWVTIDMLKEAKQNQKIGILVVEPNFYMRRFVVSEIYRAYGHLTKIFIATTCKEALNSLEKLPIDGLIMSVEMSDCEGVNFLREVRGIEKYKLTPLITLTKDPSEKMQSQLQNELRTIAHFRKMNYEKVWDFMQVLNAVEHMILLAHEKRVVLTFKQRRESDLEIDSRDFMVAWPLSTDKKMVVLHRDPLTGESVQRELLSYSFKEAKKELQKTYHQLELDRSHVFNPLMVEDVDYINGELIFKHGGLRISIPESRRKEFYQLFKGWS